MMILENLVNEKIKQNEEDEWHDKYKENKDKQNKQDERHDKYMETKDSEKSTYVDRR